jgi:predicted PurR-regulated permease PerM
MDDEKISGYGFFIVLLVLLVATIIVLRPLIAYLILSFVLTYLFYPLYSWVLKKTKKKNLSAGIMTAFIILVLVIPIIFIVISLVTQAASGISSLQGQNVYDVFKIPELSAQLSTALHTTIDLELYINTAVSNLARFLIEVKGPALLSNIADVAVGIFVMFFLMFYLFKGGRGFTEEIKELIPLKKVHKAKLFADVENMLHAIIFGQIITAVCQGIFLGIGLYATGVPNALLWTFVAIILCFIPYVATAVVFVPAAGYLYLTDHRWAALALLVYGIVIVANVDNIIKPRIIGKQAHVHPVIVLLGVIGGIKAFGLIGIIVGPIIISLLVVTLRFYASDFLRKHEDSG